MQLNRLKLQASEKLTTFELHENAWVNSKQGYKYEDSKENFWHWKQLYALKEEQGQITNNWDDVIKVSETRPASLDLV